MRLIFFVKFYGGVVVWSWKFRHFTDSFLYILFWNRTAKLIGDKRAVVAERGFNRPYSKVIVTNCGLMEWKCCSNSWFLHVFRAEIRIMRTSSYGLIFVCRINIFSANAGLFGTNRLVILLWVYTMLCKTLFSRTWSMY